MPTARPAVSLRAGATALAIALAATLTACSHANYSWNGRSATHTREFSASIDHVADRAIEVDTRMGDVTLRLDPGATTVEVDATARSWSRERVDLIGVELKRAGDRSLIVRAAWPDGVYDGPEGLSLDITIPDADGVSVSTSHGEVEFAGFSGDAVVDTTHGKLDVRDHDGDLDLRSTHGRANIAGVTGDVDVRTTHAKIEIEGVAGDIDASTTHSRVEVREHRGERLAVRSTHGSLDVETDASDVDIATTHAGVALELGHGFSGSIDARATRGSVRFDAEGHPVSTITRLDKDRLRALVGEGDADATVRTTHGSISVRFAPSPSASAGEPDA